MPKLKTHRGAAKRFKISGSGKVRHKRAGKSHLLAKKNRSTKRRMKKTVTASPARSKLLKQLLPYAS